MSVLRHELGEFGDQVISGVGLSGHGLQFRCHQAAPSRASGDLG
jgi:hypothetical protein